MSSVLYYPHYTPDEKQLRSLLLFFDTVELIVPECDQKNVQRRDHVEPLLNLDETVISFRDPAYGYETWVKRDGAGDLLRQTIDRLKRSNSKATLRNFGLSRGDFQEGGHFFHSEEKDQKAALLFSKGWRPIAFQKIPPIVFEEIEEEELGVEIGVYQRPGSGEIVEQQAVVMHPDLADFILSRLSREISDTHHVPSMTFGSIDFVSHTFSGFQDQTVNPRIDLLRTSVPLLIPDQIESMDERTFFHIRDDFKDLRNNLQVYLHELVCQHHLDNKLDAERYLERLGIAAEKIQKDIEKAEEWIGREKFREGATFAWGAVCVVLGALLGPDLPGFGKAVGPLLGYAAGDVSNRLLLGSGNRPTKGIETIARLKGTIEKDHVLYSLKYPGYI